jgi:hypothetical protein
MQAETYEVKLDDFFKTAIDKAVIVVRNKVQQKHY